jgi:DNA polymerase delta subunit 1
MGKARQLGFALPDDKAIPATEKFEGATVLDPVKGAHFEPVACLDFASLYPSVARASNLSFDSLVLDEKYGNVPGVEYLTVETGLGAFKFAQTGPDGKHRGILPDLLDDLAKFRKVAKRDMAAAKERGDDWQYALCNA